MSALDNALDELSHISPTCVTEAAEELAQLRALLVEVQKVIKPFADADFYPSPNDFRRVAELYQRLEAGE